jgi:nitrogenase molybdenum-iron protein alpha/beta subunit
VTRKKPDSWIFTFQNISSFVSGFDLQGLTTLESAGGEGVLIPVQGPRLDRDWLKGYDEVMSKTAARLLDKNGRPVELLLAGHLFCRNEADETENVKELLRLAESIGIKETVVLLSGGELAMSGIKPAHVAAMPHGGEGSRKVLARYEPGFADLPLPVGIEGTAAWLRALGKATGREAEAVSSIERELSLLVPDIQHVVTEHLAGRNAVVVGDAHLGSALARFLGELGLEVEGLFNISFTAADGVDCPVYENPSADQFAAFLADNPVDIAVGSGVFGYLATRDKVEYVELGFPSYNTHALYPKPYLGFQGARCIVDRLFNALLSRDV